jgi:hypothetical protein
MVEFYDIKMKKNVDIPGGQCRHRMTSNGRFMIVGKMKDGRMLNKFAKEEDAKKFKKMD